MTGISQPFVNKSLFQIKVENFDDNECVLVHANMLVVVIAARGSRRTRRERSVWVSALLRQRQQRGVWNSVIPDLVQEGELLAHFPITPL